MEIFKDKVQVTDHITLGGGKMVLFAGPCAAESYDICMEVGTKVKALTESMGYNMSSKLLLIKPIVPPQVLTEDLRWKVAYKYWSV